MTGRRALVLGAGGLTGIGWEWGILAGLAEHGVDLTDADLVIGTSAGSIVGAQVAHGPDLAERLRAQSASHNGELPAQVSPTVAAQWAWAVLRSRTPMTARARIGALALAARTVSEADRRAIVASRLPVKTWPDRRLLITAVDAATGEFTVFHRDSGVPLVDAVGASCAVPCVWPPVTIQGRRYMDGGARSPANADLASGYDTVVIIAPTASGFGPIPSPAHQATALRRQGAQVALITPDKPSRQAFGRNSLDPANRPAAAQAGHTQATALAPSLAPLWHPTP